MAAADNQIEVTPAMLAAGDQAFSGYWTPARMKEPGWESTGQPPVSNHFHNQLRAAYLAMRRLEAGPLAEGSK